MKFIDFGDFLNGEPATLALLSTYQFDPDYFERRLLTSPLLQRARRIAVLMDERQWFRLLQQDYPARLLNRRYLLVPVKRAGGVFHPKLSLFVTPSSTHVLCGSNNLTRAGCSRNLEILNSVVSQPDQRNEACWLAQEAFAFFRRTCADAQETIAPILRGWLDDLALSERWIISDVPLENRRRVRLIHTYDGSIWQRISGWLQSPPKRLMVVSPFYDADGELLTRAAKQWPRCKIELVVQQHTTTLSPMPLLTLRRQISLAELRNSSRRLHAKVIAWQSGEGTACLAGSANFTSAALDGRNVETCLLIEDAASDIEKLFDRGLDKRPIKFDDFVPGTETEPEPDAEIGIGPRLNAAVLGANGVLRVAYQHGLSPSPITLRVGIRAPGENHPRVLLNVPISARSAVVDLPEAALADSPSVLLASLIAETAAKRLDSVAIWVVQEARLTYEPVTGKSSTGGQQIEETGEGLAEYIEELGKTEGIAAVIEYLKRLSIRYNDGGSGQFRGRPFVLRVRDPFRPDIPPDWLLKPSPDGLSLADAIYEFADRHEHKRLRRHASRGNINGIENFLDILVAVVRLLYVYHMRGVVPRGHILGRLYKYLRIATVGIADSADHSDGYLISVSENLGRDSSLLCQIARDTQFLSHLWAILLLALEMRQSVDKQATSKRLSKYLPSYVAMLQEVRRSLSLHSPTEESISKILSDYGALTDPRRRYLSFDFRP